MTIISKKKVPYTTNFLSTHFEPEIKNLTKLDYRFSASYVINSSTNKLIFILMNPSSADETNSDRTVNRVLKYAESNQFGEVIILNTQPYYDKNKPRQGEKSIFSKNIKCIKSHISQNQNATIIVSTGTPKTRIGAFYLNQIYDLLKNNKNAKVFGSNNKAFLTEEGYPKHFSPQSLSDNEIKNLIDFSLAFNDYTLNIK